MPFSPTVAPKTDSSPIPTKPTLARGASSKKKVPPIGGGTDRSQSVDDYQDSDYEPLPIETTREQMDMGLRSIRNSANKKKATKVFDDAGAPPRGTVKVTTRPSRSRSPSPDTPSDSGISSLRSQPTDHMDQPAPRKKGSVLFMM